MRVARSKLIGCALGHDAFVTNRLRWSAAELRSAGTDEYVRPHTSQRVARFIDLHVGMSAWLIPTTETASTALAPPGTSANPEAAAVISWDPF